MIDHFFRPKNNFRPKCPIYPPHLYGERDITDLRAEGDGFGLAVRGLRADGYDVARFDLATARTVPNDAALLVIANPLDSFNPQVTRTLNEWVLDDGHLLVMVEPSPNPNDGLSRLLTAWGVEMVPGTLLDNERSAPAVCNQA